MRVEAERAAVTAPEGLVSLSIVSDSRLLREGLLSLLATYLPIELVGSYGGEPPAVALPSPANHVALVDSTLGSPRSTAWTRYWSRPAPCSYVVVMELEHNVELIMSCIEAGAAAYTLRDSSAADLAAAIADVRQGRATCSPEVAARLFRRVADLRSHLPAPQQPPPRGLTAREQEVLSYVAASYSNQQIARALVIEIHTVKHHVHNILEKLKVQHRWEAARLAREQGWACAVEPPR